MKADIFKYELPEDRIAKYPPEVRGTSKLLVIDRKSGKFQNKRYFNIPEYINEGDVVVLNETKVDNRRTFFLTEKGKVVEVLFLNEEDENWFCLIGGGRYVNVEDVLIARDDPSISLKILDKKNKGYLIQIMNGVKAQDLFEKIGHVPLPPYMKRADENSDKGRYNTVFAKLSGSSAAPTASLNLTNEILDEIKENGGKIVNIELKVGWGTFAPITEENIEDHKIHKEFMKISKDSVDIINKAKKNGNAIWAVGTTVMRTLESVAHNGLVHEFEGYTDLYIYPGYKFQIADHLITNFHQPDSSLILLVSAFAGIDTIKNAYTMAIENDYYFLSYGDSMLIL